MAQQSKFERIEQMLRRAAPEISRAQETSAREILAEQGLTPNSVIAVAADACAHAADVADSLHSQIRAIACRAGCAWCCYMPVEVDVPEVALIVDYVRRWPDADYQGLLERVRTAAAQVAGRSNDDRARLLIACPLLDQTNRCSVYAYRPTGCIGFTSLDAAACETAYRTDKDGDKNIIPFVPQIVTYARAVNLAANRSLRAAGAPPQERLELYVALRIAMENPDAISAWLRGEPVFAEARRERE